MTAGLAAAPSTAPSAAPSPTAISKFHWSTLASSPLGPRTQEVQAMVGGELLEVSGLVNVTSKSLGKVSAAAAAYDPATRRWHRIASVPGVAAASANSWSPVSTLAGRELLVADGPVKACGNGCWTGAALYNTAANRWSALKPPRQLDGLTIEAAAWTGRQLIVAAVDNIRERLAVAAYDPATRHWQVITPVLPRNHPPRIADLVAAGGRVIFWSLWDKVIPNKNGFGEYAGVDVFAMRQLGKWRDATGSWPQEQLVTSPVFTGDSILVSPGQIWCGFGCIPPFTSFPGYFANPATLARSVIPAGPLGEVNPAFVWADDAVIAVNADSYAAGPGISIQADDMALWDPASRHWTRLAAPPGRPFISVTPLWTGTELLALADSGKLLAFHG